MKSTSHKYSLVVCLITLVLGVVFHARYINEFPSSVHAWAMTDHYALALGFIHNHFDFFKPETSTYYYQIPMYVQHTESITAVDFPIHDYIPALLMKLTGTKDPWVFRVYILLYSMAGLYFLYQLSLLITQNFYKSLFIVLFAATSPVFVYYQGSFLPSIPSLSNAIIGVYCYARYINTNKERSFTLAVLFLTLATLSRTTFAIPLLAVTGVEAIRIFRRQSSLRAKLIPVLLAYTIIIAYYLYNGYLRNTYGSIFLSSLVPERSVAEALDSLARMLGNWKTTYFSVVHYLIVLVLATIFVLCLRKKTLTILPENKVLLFLAVVFFSGCVAFLFLMLQQFPDHDYYFLDTFYLPLILFIILLIAAIPFPDTSKAKVISTVLIILISIPLMIQALNFQQKRRAVHESDPVTVAIRNFSGADKFLDSIGVPRNARMLVMYTPTPNIPLILMGRKGYSVLLSDKALTSTILDWDYEYVVFQNSLFLSDVYADYPQVLSMFEKTGANDRISVWKKSKKKQVHTLNDFTGLSQAMPVFNASMSFESAHDEHWQNIHPVTEKSYRGKYSGLLTAENDFGVTYKTFQLPLLKDKSRTLYFSAYFFRNEIKDCDIVVSLDDKGKNIYYQSYNLRTLLKHTRAWEKAELTFQLPQVKSDQHYLGVYIYNSGKTQLLVDDFEFKVY